MQHPIDLHVGDKLKQARVLRRMSQTDVAKQVELSFQQVQKYETGANRISASRLFEFSQILDVPTSYFFEGLHCNDNEQPSDASMDIVSAIAAITDDRVKERVVTFINDVSGLTVARGR